MWNSTDWCHIRDISILWLKHDQWVPLVLWSQGTSTAHSWFICQSPQYSRHFWTPADRTQNIQNSRCQFPLALWCPIWYPSALLSVILHELTLCIVGLIHYKMITHCFIDGHTQLVTGIWVSNNNRSATVFDLFLYAIAMHVTPSRMRGDHGTENVLVTTWMELYQGVEQGSYIWGRYVNLYNFYPSLG